MDHEGRQTQREAANQIAARYAGKARAVMRRAAVSSMGDSETSPAIESGKREGGKPATEASIVVRDEVIDTATSKVVQVTERDFCPNCQWVKLMNPEGVGWCQEHGDINDK